MMDKSCPIKVQIK